MGTRPDNSLWAIARGAVIFVFWLLVAVVSVIATVVGKIVVGALLLAVRIGAFVCRNPVSNLPLLSRPALRHVRIACSSPA